MMTATLGRELDRTRTDRGIFIRMYAKEYNRLARKAREDTLFRDIHERFMADYKAKIRALIFQEDTVLDSGVEFKAF